MEPLAYHILTHIHTFLSFFPTDMGCFTREAFTKALGSSQKPFVRGAFTRRAFTGEWLCKGPNEASSGASSFPHTYTHMQFSVFCLQIWGCITRGVFTKRAFTREWLCKDPSKASTLPHTYTHMHFSVFFLQIWGCFNRGLLEKPKGLCESHLLECLL